ncbi:MAG TPA: MlaD family protein [Solirubrobacteraceae bacterium]|nr:MlaD family protein [Solirubrobacteraceae bacterium]
MRPRHKRDSGLRGNAVVIGALTVLVAIIAVVLAYQSNNGLPFVPRYHLHVQIADAAELTRGAEVHMGGSLVGTVASVAPARSASGEPIAMLNLTLNKNVDPLAIDSTFTVRLKDAVGLKYLQVVPGHAKRTWPDGATVPESQASAEVDLDQFLNMFTPPTRTGVTASTTGFGDALAGRGNDINNAIGAFVPLVTDLGPVMRNLATPSTGLGDFFRGLEAFTGALVPVAQPQASLYVHLDATFRALASVAVPYLQNWISDTPPTFRTVITDSPAEQSFLKNTTALFTDLRPGFATLPASAPVLADAFAAGARNLPGTIALDRRTEALARTLDVYSANITAAAGLDRLTLTAASLRTPLAFLTPVQATCNYVTLFLRNTASLLSDRISTGTTLRAVPIAIDDVTGGEGVPSQHPYTTPATSPTQQHGPLHDNPYPNTDSPGEPAECAAGNEPFSGRAAVIGNPPGSLGVHTEQTRRPGG